MYRFAVCGEGHRTPKARGSSVWQLPASARDHFLGSAGRLVGCVLELHREESRLVGWSRTQGLPQVFDSAVRAAAVSHIKKEFAAGVSRNSENV
jgi:hypothetical protein